MKMLLCVGSVYCVPIDCIHNLFSGLEATYNFSVILWLFSIII